MTLRNRLQTRRSSRRHAFRLGGEPLERRQMLSTSPLTITATDGDDTIEAYVSEGYLNVVVNGITVTYDSSLVTHLEILGGDGNDSIFIDESVEQETTLRGEIGRAAGRERV